VLIAPFAVMPWPLAHYIWTTANVAFLAITIWSIALLIGFRMRQRRTWVFVIAASLFAPVHTTLHHGQTPLYVMALMLPAFVIRSRATAGALLGLASALKPQIGLPGLALEIVRERWRTAIIAAITLGLVLAIAVLPMSLRGIGWFEQWQANLQASFATGPTSFEAHNLQRYHMINLQYPLVALTEHARVSGIAAMIVCGLLAAVFFLPPRQRMAGTPLVVSLSMVAVLTLMVAYHRFYDAVLLLIPLGWAIDRIARGGRTVVAWCALGTMIPFFFNSATSLKWLQNSGQLPGWLVDSWWWERLIMAHLGWALLAMAVCLIIEQRQGHAAAAGRTPATG
jgi:alpha-1,2-mannosyltransferase